MLRALEIEDKRDKYPSIPESYIPLTDWNDNSANALTKCVIAWITYAIEHISNQDKTINEAMAKIKALEYQNQLLTKQPSS